MRYVFLVLLCVSLLVSARSPHAAETTDEQDTILEAITLAAEADAYSAYCDNPTENAPRFIARLRENNRITADDAEALDFARLARKMEVENLLRQNAQSCTDITFMLAQVEVMRRLKDASYRLNGQEPPEEVLPEELVPPVPQTEIQPSPL